MSMAKPIPEMLQSLSAKASLLAERYDLVKAQRDEARERCLTLEQETARLQAELQQARTQIEYLQVSHKIAPTPDQARQAQDMLMAMVKKIDKCIRRLKAD